MSNSILAKIEKIKQQQIGASDKVALIVEGADDVDFYSQMLTKRHRAWASRFCIAEAGGKNKVIDILTRQPGW